MTGRRRTLVIVLFAAGALLVLVGIAALGGGASRRGTARANQILVEAARTQMRATEKLLEAVEDINSRLTALEDLVLNEDGGARAAAHTVPWRADLDGARAALVAASAVPDPEPGLDPRIPMAAGLGLLLAAAWLRPPQVVPVPVPAPPFPRRGVEAERVEGARERPEEKVDV